MNITVSTREFLIHIKVLGLSERTQNSYRVDLTSFSKFLKKNGIEDTEDITLPIIKLGIEEMLDRGVKASSTNAYFKRIKKYIDYIWEQGYGGFNTKGKYPRVKEEKTIIKTFTPEQVKIMLASCGGGSAYKGKTRDSYCDARDYLVLCLAFDLGLRNTEIRQLKPEQIFSDYILVKGKGNKQRVVPLTAVCLKAMIKYENAKEEWFKTRQIKSDTYFLSWKGNMLSTTDMNGIFKKRGMLIKDDTIRCSPHDARHFFAQQKLKSGTDIYSLSVLLGHSDTKTTVCYLRGLQNSQIVEMERNNSVLMNL